MAAVVAAAAAAVCRVFAVATAGLDFSAIAKGFLRLWILVEYISVDVELRDGNGKMAQQLDSSQGIFLGLFLSLQNVSSLIQHDDILFIDIVFDS